VACADVLVMENDGIVARLKAGDPTILQELIQHYHERLRRYLMRLTSDRDLCEDLLQETWMRVVSHGAQFRGESQFTTWLFAVARNLAFDRNRRLARHRPPEPLPEPGEGWHPSLFSHDRSPFELYSGEESGRLLIAGIQSLKPPYREVLQMHLEEDLSIQEIAGRMGLPVPLVKSRFYRALALLKPKLMARTSFPAIARQNCGATAAHKHFVE